MNIRRMIRPALFSPLAALIGASLLSSGALAAPAGHRLIETGDGVQKWASPSEMEALSHAAHAEGRCGGYMDVTDFPDAAEVTFQPLLNLAALEPKEQATVTPMIKRADEGELLAIVTKLSSYKNRYYDSATGVESANWIKSQYEHIAKGHPDIEVDLVAHKFRQPSVIATIAGNGPNRDEIVVIGGHIDSITGFGGDTHAPGADDNASGTATVLEAFRHVVESGFKPNRTIQFMGYAGEEKGLLGSQDIAAQYRKKGSTVVGVLQLDMTMYPGSTPRITFITDHTNRDLTTFTQKLTDEYVKMPWQEDRCGYACSDHASWTRNGFASAFPFETSFGGYNPNIHTSRDTTTGLDPGHGLSYLKLAMAFAVELAQAKDGLSFAGN